MNQQRRCKKCGAEIPAEQTHCIRCESSREDAREMANVPAAEVRIEPQHAPAPSTTPLPPPMPNRAALEQAGKDRQLVGVGLLMLGFLSLIGGTLALFSTSTMDRLDFDTFISYAAAGGGLVMVMVVVGSILVAPRGGDATAIGSHAMVSTLLSVVTAIAIAGIVVVAGVIYLIHDCLTGCQPK